MVFGAINGGPVTILRLPPFIVTLGTFTAILAGTRLLAGSETYRVEKVHPQPWARPFASGRSPRRLGVVTRCPGLPRDVVVRVVPNSLGAKTYLRGRWQTHRHRICPVSGPARAVLRSSHDGVIAAIAAWAALWSNPQRRPERVPERQSGRTSPRWSSAGPACSGGRGGVVGTLVGIRSSSVLRNGLTQAGVDKFYQNIATGILVIVAVAGINSPAGEHNERRTAPGGARTRFKKYGHVTAINGADFELLRARCPRSS